MSRLLARIVVPAWLLLTGPVEVRSQERPKSDPGRDAGPDAARILWDPPRDGHVDLHGDPLPAGARARIGSSRFRRDDRQGEPQFSPDGKILAASGREATFLWDVATGRRIGRVPGGLAAFFDTGKSLAMVRGGRLWFWTLNKTTDTPLPLPGPEVDFARPVGKDRLALFQAGRIALWDLNARKEVARFGNNLVEDFKVAPDGRRIATRRRPEIDQRLTIVELWNAETGQLVKEVMRTDNCSDNVNFSPDSARLSAKDFSPQPLVMDWSSKTGEELKSEPAEVEKKVRQPWDRLMAEFRSPDGTMLASFWLTEVVVTDVPTGRPLWRQTMLAQSGTFSPESALLAISEHSRIRLFDPRAGKEFLTAGDNDTVHYARLSADGKTVATHSANLPDLYGIHGDKRLRFWNAATGAAIEPAPVAAVRAMPAPQLVSENFDTGVVLVEDRRVETWDLRTGEKLSTVDVGPEYAIASNSLDLASFLKGARNFEGARQPREPLVRCDVRTGKPFRPPLAEFSNPIVSPDSRWMVSDLPGESPQHIVGIWDFANLKLKHKLILPRTGSMQFSADGRVLSHRIDVSSEDNPSGQGELRFFDPATGESIAVPAKSDLALEKPSHLDNLTFLRGDNRRLLSIGENTLFLWDRVEGRRLRSWPVDAYWFQLSKDHRTLMTIGYGEILVWDLSEMMKGL